MTEVMPMRLFPALTDSEVLGAVQRSNRPDLAPQPSTSPQSGVPTTPASPPPGPRKVRMYIEDDDVAQAKRYWEEWVTEAARSLLSGHKGPERPRRELMVTARLEPGPYYRRPSDAESVNTDISLLSTSSFGAINPKVKKTKRSKIRVQNKEPEVKTDWVKLANERRGLLDRMMRQDTAGLGAYGQTNPSDVMSKEERALLMGCAYKRGMPSREKSKSTMNVLSLVKKEEARPYTEGAFRGTQQKRMNTERFRTPSPKNVARKFRARDHVRPVSAAGALNGDLVGCSPSPSSSSASISMRRSPGRHPPPASAPGVMTRFQHQVKVKLPEHGSAYSQRVNKRVQATVAALGRHTGFGDPKDTINLIHGEGGRYTESDYAHIPRYPQNIRVAPQLAKIIQQDIHQRMGRPRKHEIRVKDVELFEKDFTPLGRSQRNLLVFNWLLSLNEDEFEVKRPPDIFDLEGCPPRSRGYPDLWDAASQCSSGGPSPLISEDEDSIGFSDCDSADDENDDRCS